VDPATVRAAVETNVIGVIRVTNAMLPLLRRSASPRIVNMSSSVGSLTLQTTPGTEMGPISLAYAASKTFLNAVTIQYVKELRDTGILINAACPGYVATDLNGFRGVRTPEQGAAIAIRLATLPDDGPNGGFFEDEDFGLLPVQPITVHHRLYRFRCGRQRPTLGGGSLCLDIHLARCGRILRFGGPGRYATGRSSGPLRRSTCGLRAVIPG
jgi:hypothetical protein